MNDATKTNELKWRFSRSHSEDFKKCPRYYWLRYHEQGTGLQPKRLSLGLSKGTCVHAILQTVLAYVRDEHKVPPSDVLRSFINAHTDAFVQSAKERMFEGVEDNDTPREAQRQAALVEGMVRAWVKVRLPFIVANYDVVAVEEEREVCIDPDGQIILMDRPDAELFHRESHLYAALELKTTSTDKDQYFDSWRFATQTMGHILAMEAKYGERKVGHILMEFMHSGTHKLDKLSGQTIYYSPLVRGYVLPEDPPLRPKDTFSWVHKGQKGWRPLDVWEYTFGDKPAWMTPVEYWVEHALDNEAVQAQLFTREIFRSESEMEEWKQKVLSQQRRIQVGVQSAQDPALKAQVMNWAFPGNKDESCYQNKYFKQCEFLPICYGQLAEGPLESGLYDRREPHHEQEFDV